ncbi:MAG: 50S ribosomal protein L23 [Endomicrobiia bacterium]
MDIIQKPIITEKMTKLGEKLNKYGFVVDVRADKKQIKKAIEDLYGVTIENVNTIRCRRDYKTRYTKSGMIQGKSKAIKKAIVTLKEGDKIDFYSNI